MNTNIFSKLLQKVSNHVRRKKDRNILQLMDNFSGHALLDDKIIKLTYEGGFRGFQYQNFLVLFLLPNVASVCRPLDQCVIATFKVRCRRQHIAWVLQKLKNDVDQRKIKVRTQLFPIIS